MANQIRLKRASGSDPGASDLVLGEPAVRTDTGEIFLKKDDGSIAKVAGGIDDGDKGDITVSNSGATFTIDSGVIDNANVASNAAIAGSKISPSFTSDITITSTVPRIFLTDSNNNSDFAIANSNGVFKVNDQTNSLTRFSIASDGTTTILQNLDVGAGVDVTGNITVSGTVDGRDVATDGSKLDGIAAGATNVTNTNQLTNGAGFITATLTNEQVQDIVGGMVSGNTESGITVTYQDSDGTLDFSVASQTDNNFTNADHSKLDGIEAGATADQTASEILTLLKTVDGSGSGLDADTLDGASASQFVRSDADDTLNGQYTISDTADEKLILSGSSNPYIRWREGTTNKAYIQWHSSGYFDFVNAESGERLRVQSGSNGLKYGIDSTFYKVWHEANDGSGTGLDADTLDGVQGSSFLRSDAADSASVNLTINGLEIGSWSGGSTYKGIFHTDQSGSEYMMINNDGHTFISASTGGSVYVRTGNNDSTNQLIVSNGSNGLTWRGSKVFHAGNDGAGSGLDADSVDGIAGSSLLRSDAADTASGDITFSGGAGAATIAANSDIRFTNGNWTGNSTKIQHHNNSLYIQGGSGATDTMALIFRSSGGTNRWIIDSSGHFHPHVDSTYDIGTSSKRIRIGYFDEVDSGEVRVNNGILETKAAIASSYTITTDYNALAVDPTINNGITVTVPSGSVWAIV